MKNKLNLLVAVAIAAVLLAYMFAFQVRYDEVAIRTTFDKVDDNSVIYGKTDAGLHYRLPWPVQKVEKYTTRTQMLEDLLRQEPTKDQKSLTIRTYMTWRVADPREFFVSLGNTARAETTLRPLLAEEIKRAFAQYNFDQLVNLDPAKIKLAEIEQRATASLSERIKNLKYGVKVEQVGLSRLVLPQENTEQVFERMRSVRDTMAKNAQEQGKAQARAIRARAESTRDLIMQFAESRAEAIRTQGKIEAARFYSLFKENEELAVFLRRIETLKEVLAHNTTFVLDASQLKLDLLNEDVTGGKTPLASPGKPSPAAKQ